MQHTSWRVYEVLALATAGAAFSGYLSAVKFFSQGCALTVPCPFFLGYPACYYGFGMFVLLFILAFLWALGRPLRAWVLGLASLGTLFALYFSALELPQLLALLSHFALLAVPSCAVGLLIYAAILYLAWREAPQSPTL